MANKFLVYIHMQTYSHGTLVPFELIVLLMKKYKKIELHFTNKQVQLMLLK